MDVANRGQLIWGKLQIHTPIWSPQGSQAKWGWEERDLREKSNSGTKCKDFFSPCYHLRRRTVHLPADNPPSVRGSASRINAPGLQKVLRNPWALTLSRLLFGEAGAEHAVVDLGRIKHLHRRHRCHFPPNVATRREEKVPKDQKRQEMIYLETATRSPRKPHGGWEIDTATPTSAKARPPCSRSGHLDPAPLISAQVVRRSFPLQYKPARARCSSSVTSLAFGEADTI